MLGVFGAKYTAASVYANDQSGYTSWEMIFLASKNKLRALKHDTPDRLAGGKVMSRSRLAAAYQNRAG
jgi:hypothetical protein